MPVPDVSLGPAIAQLRESGRPWSEPRGFVEYVAECFPGRSAKPPPFIAVGTWSQLRKEAKDAGVMVFRLGEGRFALLDVGQTKLRDFFLWDPDLFSSPAETFLPDAPVTDLYPFQLLGSIQEGGAVNLALATGLLGHALELDRPYPRVAPARGQSTYTFRVRPSASYAAEWLHSDGQVEVDATFLARRKGRWLLFVVEAKHGAPRDATSLSKLKLAYPAATLAAKRVPADVGIVPVYVRSWSEPVGGAVHFGIAECSEWPKQGGVVAELAVTRARVFSVPLLFVQSSS